MKNGLNGYVVLIDFSNFFPNCSHNVIRDIHRKFIYNDDIIKLIEDYLFIKDGIPLGIEMAQQEALMLPNKLDHLVANQYPIVRFMDDNIFLVKTRDEALKILDRYQNISKELGVILNKKKIRIIKLGKTFVFCKWKYCVLKNGEIIMMPVHDTVLRQKKKLKKMRKKNISTEEIELTTSCFKAYLNMFNY